MKDHKMLNVVLCWHMHQPQYRDIRTGEYRLPWTYLHATKDYVDMAAHLEACPEARAVVNFAPVLLEQIDDYASQVKRYLETGQAVSDHLLAALVNEAATSPEQRVRLMQDCLKVHEDRFINRFPAYRRLADMAGIFLESPDMLLYVGEHFISDIVVWYHLAWIGETVRRNDSRIAALVEKAVNFNQQDRYTLMTVIGELLSGVIDRYRILAEKGQVELSMTPYAHPIVPLMLDIGSARDAMPDAILPELQQYPGGEERVRWHFNKGIEAFRQYFGIKPVGCWPSEGSVSTETMRFLDDYGFKWAASGENVFRNSYNAAREEGGKSKEKAQQNALYHPYRVAGSTAACFFRDDGLSDLIGFEYSTWHADDAVANLVEHLEKIATAMHKQKEREGDKGDVVSIILDGENAWEHYPENGFYFLDALYRKINDSDLLTLTTFSDCLEDNTGIRELPRLVAGSWVYGSFSTWIGEKDKNRGWDMLGDAKRAFDMAVSSNKLSPEQLAAAEMQLAVCEGSDWFWWFGDYNPEDSVSDFERLFRQHLTGLFELLGEAPPDYLSRSFTRGGGSPQTGGVMRPGSE